jgi:putative membrane protein
MMTSLEHLPTQIVSAVIFTLIGLVFFAVLFKIIVTVSPFSVRKEIEEDQNIALAILIGSAFISIGLIISAAIHG